MAKENVNQPHNEDYEYDTLTNDRLIKDHDYDGIRELDNDLPPWWKWLFYITIVFAIIYLIRLFVFHADDLVQDKEYENVMAEAAAEQPQQDAAAFEIVLLEDDASLASGEETWGKICSACHLADGGGLVGPNMTDNYWIHGNTVEVIFWLNCREQHLLTQKNLRAKNTKQVIFWLNCREQHLLTQKNLRAKNTKHT